jgi:hypothetical protein
MAWQHVTMDFIEALPKSEGLDTIMVVVDKLTKYAHFIGDSEIKPLCNYLLIMCSSYMAYL